MTRLPALARRALQCVADDRGGTLPLIAVGLTAVFGAGAIAMDASHLYALRGNLQATADAAARSAAWEIPDADETRQTAVDYAETNMAPGTHGEVLAPGDVTVGTWDYQTRSFTAGGADTNAVRVVTRRAEANGNPVALIFAPVLGSRIGNVVTEAVASRVNLEACVLALSGSGTGLHFEGGVDVDASQCAFAANSTSPNAALAVDGSSGNATLEGLYLGGGMSDPHGTIHSTDQPITNASRPLPDPYADREFNDFPVSVSPTAHATSTPNSSVTLEPGVYPNGFDFKGDVTMQPGVYVMRGDVEMTSHADVTGNGVTIALENSDISVAGGATTDLTAPTTGSTAGIVLMRDGPPTSSAMEGGASMVLNGAVYMPETDLRYAGTSDPGGCLQIVANSVEFAGDTDFNIDCSALGAEDIVIDVVLLVS